MVHCRLYVSWVHYNLAYRPLNITSTCMWLLQYGALLIICCSCLLQCHPLLIMCLACLLQYSSLCTMFCSSFRCCSCWQSHCSLCFATTLLTAQELFLIICGLQQLYVTYCSSFCINQVCYSLVCYSQVTHSVCCLWGSKVKDHSHVSYWFYHTIMPLTCLILLWHEPSSTKNLGGNEAQ